MKGILSLILQYTLWFISTGVTILLVVEGRSFYFNLIILFTRNFWIINFLDKILILILVLVGMVIIIILEEYYRKGLEKRKLLERFLLITGIQILIFTLLQNIPLTLYGFPQNPVRILKTIAELVFSIFLISFAVKKITS